MDLRKLAMPGVIAASVIAGGGTMALVNSVVANAATATTAASTTTSATTATPAAMPAHGSASHEDTETAVTGDNATKAQAAAVKSVGSGTAGTVTSDFTHSGYETTVTKGDGSTVEVHLDSSFSVMAGGPHGSGPAGSN